MLLRFKPSLLFVFLLFVLLLCSGSVIGQPVEGGTAGDGDRRLGDGRRSELALLCSAGSADGGTPVDAAAPRFMSPRVTSSRRA